MYSDVVPLAFHHRYASVRYFLLHFPLPSPSLAEKTCKKCTKTLHPSFSSDRRRKDETSSSSLNFEQSRPTSRILLFYNCVPDYDKGHQTERGSPFLFSLLSFSFSRSYPILNKRSLSFFLRRSLPKGMERWGFEYVFRSLSLSLFLLTLLPRVIYSRINEAEKKSARFETVVEWK